MNYEDLLNEYADEDLIIKEKPLQSSHGRIYNNRIAIRHDMSSVDKTCTLAEELGHYYTTTGDIIDQEDTSNRKQEYRARNRLRRMMRLWRGGFLIPDDCKE